MTPWKDKTYLCKACNQPRPPGRSLCPACAKTLRKERYELDPKYRSSSRRSHSRWREENLASRAEYMREYRARKKEERDRTESNSP
ncbi:hypothetical protein Dxin01_00123 [Deinococcus xinjiangensis]|uniref:Uncharacterized protein n=1 Tax=Deinococcus xinjiangensis TaxID=457454 RepID=A0ABP9V551_9DEIO